VVATRAFVLLPSRTDRRSAGAARRPCRTNPIAPAGKLQRYRRVLHRPAVGSYWNHCARQVSQTQTAASLRATRDDHSQEIRGACVDAEPAGATSRPCERHGMDTLRLGRAGLSAGM
jgi:hypothetical protein